MVGSEVVLALTDVAHTNLKEQMISLAYWDLLILFAKSVLQITKCTIEGSVSHSNFIIQSDSDMNTGVI